MQIRAQFRLFQAKAMFKQHANLRIWTWILWLQTASRNELPCKKKCYICVCISWHFLMIKYLYIEDIRWVSFDIKFTKQGFENACWHRAVCWAIQHAFSKSNLVNLISKYANLVFHLSVTHCFTLQTGEYNAIFIFCVDSASLAT